VPGFAIVRHVQITVRLEQADVDALSELREWLLEADAVRRYARLRWADTDESGTGGIGLDALQLVVGNGFSVRQLVVAIGHWQGSRESGPKVLICRRGPDGSAAATCAVGPQAMEEAIQVLEAG